jgi:hypothetical protein
MPVVVTCKCGVVFRLPDGPGGNWVQCPVCNATMEVSGGGPRAERVCPRCCEAIPADAVVCPVCYETLGGANLGKWERMFFEARKQLRTHVQSAAATDRDNGICGKRAARAIRSTKSPQRAMKRYVQAVLGGDTDKAYVAVAPSGRCVQGIKPLPCKELPVIAEPGGFSDQDSFRLYWTGVVNGPLGGGPRTVRLAGVDVLDESSDMALCGVRYVFSGYPKLHQRLLRAPLRILKILTVFLWVILVVIRESVRYSNIWTKPLGKVTKWVFDARLDSKERLKVVKLMFREGGMWFIAEGAFEGPLDVGWDGGTLGARPRLSSPSKRKGKGDRGDESTG